MKYSNCIKKNRKNTKCPFLKTKIHSVDNKIFLKIFKSDKTLSENQEIKPGKNIRFILHLESIWVYNKSFGINWYIVQAEVKLPDILQSYCFDNNMDQDVISNHEIYKKFFKMINLGVPKEAVKLKMKLEGLDSDIIDLEPTTLSKIALNKNTEMLENNPKITKNIPIPPPPPPNNIVGNVVKINPFDLKNVKLKKNPLLKKEKVEIIDLRVPTKNQIIEQIKILKKVN